MFTKQYDNNGNHVGYKKDNTFYTLEYSLPEDSDIEDGDKPSAKDIEINKALEELIKSDREVIKNISRVIEDYFDAMPKTQQDKLYKGFKDAVANKKLKRKAYLDLL